MHKDVKSLKEIITTSPELRKVKSLIKESEILDKFYEIFPNLIKVAKPEKVSKKILYIKVENPAWRAELKFQEEKVIEKINNFFGEKRIKFLKLLG